MSHLTERTLETFTFLCDGMERVVDVVELVDPETEAVEGYDLHEQLGGDSQHLNEGSTLYERPTRDVVETYLDCDED